MHLNSWFVSDSALFLGKGSGVSGLVTLSTGEMVEFQDLFSEFEFFVGMDRPSALVTHSTGEMIEFQDYFQNLNFLWEWFDPCQLFY